MENDREKFKSEFKQRLYKFILDLIKFIEDLPNDNTCQVIKNQLLRSGTSILANYIEAQAASSRKDFTNFFHHSLKSANESEIWLSLLKDTRKANEVKTEGLIKELKEIANILASSIITLKNKR